MSFVEAIEKLADRFHVQLEEVKGDDIWLTNSRKSLTGEIPAWLGAPI